MPRQALAAPVALLALAALAVHPARADWLVTRDGARVETEGAWEVKGKLVVFTTADGDLASLRLADVDLPASTAATEEAKAKAAASGEPAKKSAPVKRKSVRAFTDKDFRQAAPASAAAEAQPAAGEDAAAKQAAAPPAAAASPLRVTSWERRQATDEHVQIAGALNNPSADTATAANLVVRLYDEAGGVVAAVQATIENTALPSGASTSFVADFPGVFAFAAVKFEVSSTQLRSSSEPGGAPPPPR